MISSQCLADVDPQVHLQKQSNYRLKLLLASIPTKRDHAKLRLTVPIFTGEAMA